jgi:hypothetical protein
MPGIVQIGCLGHLGRWGNQCFQYACARAYARKVGAVLETNRWIGQTLFNLDDPPISKALPQLDLDMMPTDDRTDFCFYGYFQHKTAFDLYTQSDLRNWFTFRDWVLEEMKDYGSVPLAAHIRRGDYVTTFKDSFCTIDEQAYHNAFKFHQWLHLPVTWVREDKPTVFKRQGLEWLIDFVTLMRAGILFRANSTFSWWAATLGNHDFVYSPVIEGKRGHHTDVHFTSGNWPRCTDQPNVHDFFIK